MEELNGLLFCYVDRYIRFPHPTKTRKPTVVISIHINPYPTNILVIWDKVFKIGLSKFCERQPLKIY